MEIALVCPDDISIVLFCKGLVKRLQNIDEKNRLYIICDIYGEHSGGYYTNVIKSWGVVHIPVKFYRFVHPLKDLKYILFLYKIFRTERIEMVINISTKPNIYGTIAAKLAHVKKIVCSVWGMGTAFSSKDDLKSKLLRFLVLGLYRIAFTLSSKVWFTNENDANYFVYRGAVTAQKLILTKNYVNTEDYSPSSVNEERLFHVKKELGLTEHNKVVVMVGRMSWAKGIKEFVEASIILREKLPMVKFILVGPKDEGSPDSVPESYLRENEQHGNFMWIGFRNDVKELYAISALAVLPSYYREGGFPRGLTEPMSMGKPIITTNSVHCRSTVEEGKNGYLVPVKDSMALANAIERLMQDDKKREEFGRYSRLKAEKEFNEKVIVSKAIQEMLA